MLHFNSNLAEFPLRQQSPFPESHATAVLKTITAEDFRPFLFFFAAPFINSKVVSGQAKTTLVQNRASPAPGCPRPLAMAGEHSVSAPPPLSQCFSAPPSKVSN